MLVLLNIVSYFSNNVLSSLVSLLIEKENKILQLGIKIFECYMVYEKKSVIKCLKEYTGSQPLSPIALAFFLPLHFLYLPASVSASCEVAGTQLPLPIHG